MNIGQGSSNEPEVMMDINTTPLIDVMLVLLIMMIVTLLLATIVFTPHFLSKLSARQPTLRRRVTGL
jgi:biopolymer transport protein ExbD